VAVGAGASTDRLAWSALTEGDETTVFIPLNLESQADNPLALAALAASISLGAKFEYATEGMADSTLDKKAKAYLTGVSWGLSAEGKHVPQYQEVSGPTGAGFYWVCHRGLETVTGSTWWARGAPKHLTQGITGKTWSKSLDPVIRRIESLITRAASKKDPVLHARTWLRSKESFLGAEVRKALPTHGTTIISQTEKDFLHSKFINAITLYNNVFADFSDPNIALIQGLKDRFDALGKSMRPFAYAVERITSHRMSKLYPAQKGKKQKDRTSLATKIGQLSREETFNIFDPLVVLDDFSPFKYKDDTDFEDAEASANIAKQYVNVLTSKFRASRISESYAEQCKSWALTILGVADWEV